MTVFEVIETPSPFPEISKDPVFGLRVAEGPEIQDISCDRAAVERLARELDELQPERIHLFDIIEDFVQELSML